MVLLSVVQASNAVIATELPPDLTAVFVGGTSGVGHFTLREFARHVPRPKVYFIGRSKEAGERIEKECKEINANGEYTFIQADTSLIKTVDEVCDRIKKEVKQINLLHLTTGTTARGKSTCT
jgi:NADP-dependent 3-hydroxy acid dehydrogenase YdfG